MRRRSATAWSGTPDARAGLPDDSRFEVPAVLAQSVVEGDGLPASYKQRERAALASLEVEIYR
jgi:hypothetical protein